LRFWRRTKEPFGAVFGAGVSGISEEVRRAEEAEESDGTKVKGFVGKAGLVIYEESVEKEVTGESLRRVVGETRDSEDLLRGVTV